LHLIALMAKRKRGEKRRGASPLEKKGETRSFFNVKGGGGGGRGKLPQRKGRGFPPSYQLGNGGNVLSGEGKGGEVSQSLIGKTKGKKQVQSSLNR